VITVADARDHFPNRFIICVKIEWSTPASVTKSVIETALDDNVFRKRVNFWRLGAGIESIPALNCQNKAKKRKILSLRAVLDLNRPQMTRFQEKKVDFWHKRAWLYFNQALLCQNKGKTPKISSFGA
jgi:hypothetical protein